MSTKRQRISFEELLSRYATGERNFINIEIWDWRRGLFKGVDLSGINLEKSAIDIDLSDAILKNANFRNTIWGGNTWESTNFTGSDMSGVHFNESCFFVNCNFSETVWNQAELFQSTFKDCNLWLADFNDARLIEVDLYG